MKSISKFGRWCRIKFKDGIYCKDCKFYSSPYGDCEEGHNAMIRTKKAPIKRIVLKTEYHQPPERINHDNKCKYFRSGVHTSRNWLGE